LGGGQNVENHNVEGSEGRKFYTDDQNVKSQKDQNVKSFIKTSKITLSKKNIESQRKSVGKYF
jgi:hypothetical protein